MIRTTEGKYRVFMRTTFDGPTVRAYLQHLTEEAIPVDSWVIDLPPYMNYLECERIMSKGIEKNAIYVITDNDIIPATAETIGRMCNLLEQHPEIGILGIPAKPHMDRSEIEGWIVGEDIASNLLDIDHVGGVFAIRTGAMLDDGERPNLEKGIGDDMVLCRQVRRHGFKVALWLEENFFHIGEGKSTLWTRVG